MEKTDKKNRPFNWTKIGISCTVMVMAIAFSSFPLALIGSILLAYAL